MSAWSTREFALHAAALAYTTNHCATALELVELIVDTYEHALIRPIAEAPVDGTQILTFDPTSPVAWCQDYQQAGDPLTLPGWAMNPDSRPTHFRPLPPEPTS